MSSNKPRALLIDWEPSCARRRAQWIRSAGWVVIIETEDGGRAYRKFQANPPDAVVIAMSPRLSHGRETARSLAKTVAARKVPMLFIGGTREERANISTIVMAPVFVDDEQLLVFFQRLRTGGTQCRGEGK